MKKWKSNEWQIENLCSCHNNSSVWKSLHIETHIPNAQLPIQRHETKIERKTNRKKKTKFNGEIPLE